MVSALCTLPVLAGMRLGVRLRDRLPAGALRSLILAVVFLGGVNLIMATNRGQTSSSRDGVLPLAANADR
jgi:uncharacterized membrane protein YfcA